MTIEQRLRRLESTVLLERNYSNIISISNSVQSKIISLKSLVLNCKDSEEILGLLNNKLSDLEIQFEFSDQPGFDIDSSYSEVGIHFASTSENGEITIYVFEDLVDTVFESNFLQFSKVIKSIVTHELTHVDQLEKSRGNFKSADISSDFSYLLNVHEIQAHANQAVEQALDLGFTLDEIKGLLRNPKSSKISPSEIGAFWKYYDFFYSDDKTTWNKFSKYCFQYIQQLKDEST